MKGVLKIEDSSQVFFTSDFHANHANIIKIKDGIWLPRKYAKCEYILNLTRNNENM